MNIVTVKRKTQRLPNRWPIDSQGKGIAFVLRMRHCGVHGGAESDADNLLDDRDVSRLWSRSRGRLGGASLFSGRCSRLRLLRLAGDDTSGRLQRRTVSVRRARSVDTRVLSGDSGLRRIPRLSAVQLQARPGSISTCRRVGTVADGALFTAILACVSPVGLSMTTSLRGRPRQEDEHLQGQE
jgi:hypothetical protein